MLGSFFAFLTQVNDLFWGWIGFSLILVLGLYLSVVTGFFQIRAFPGLVRSFFESIFHKEEGKGIHPLRTFFASVGGMVGVGNLVGIVTAIQIGGPGALLWVWVTALLGSVIKYGEVFLAFKYRVENTSSFDGGPMYVLARAFRSKIVPVVVALFLCIYGVEIYQFSVITETLTTNWHLDKTFVIAALIAGIFYVGLGGVRRVGKICAVVMPVFILVYSVLALWVIGVHIGELPAILSHVFRSAFTGEAAIGGFAGSTALIAIQQGSMNAAYSADIGIGLASIMQSESSAKRPETQARLAAFGVFLDNFICTLSVLLVLVTGIWQSGTSVPASEYVQHALATSFPAMEIFVPMLILFLGFMTTTSYFCIGLKCARYLSPRFGLGIFLGYAFFAFVFFSFFDQLIARQAMGIAGGGLLVFNLIGVFLLRKEIVFTGRKQVAEPIAEIA